MSQVVTLEPQIKSGSSADARVWVRNVRDLLKNTSETAEKLGGTGGGHVFSAAFNMSSLGLTAVSLVAPVLAPVASILRMMTTGLIGMNIINRLGVVKGNTGRFGASTFFDNDAAQLKKDIAGAVTETGMEAPQGLVEAVDKYSKGLRSIHNGHRIDLAAKFAITAGAVAATVLTGGTVALAFAGATAALSAEHVLYNYLSADKGQDLEKAGVVIEDGVSRLGDKLQIARWQVENPKAAPAPAAA